MTTLSPSHLHLAKQDLGQETTPVGNDLERLAKSRRIRTLRPLGQKESSSLACTLVVSKMQPQKGPPKAVCSKQVPTKEKRSLKDVKCDTIFASRQCEEREKLFSQQTQRPPTDRSRSKPLISDALFGMASSSKVNPYFDKVLRPGSTCSDQKQPLMRNSPQNEDLQHIQDNHKSNLTKRTPEKDNFMFSNTNVRTLDKSRESSASKSALRETLPFLNVIEQLPGNSPDPDKSLHRLQTTQSIMGRAQGIQQIVI